VLSNLEGTWDGPPSRLFEDWYVSFGEGKSRNWEDARRFGFVSARGGPWYTGTLKKLPIGGRVFVNLPGRGYVGIGTVTGKAEPAGAFTVSVEGETKLIADVALLAPNLTANAAKDDDETEWFVPVSWVKTVPASQAIAFNGKTGIKTAQPACEIPLHG
jgi:hypothetical protein